MLQPASIKPMLSPSLKDCLSNLYTFSQEFSKAPYIIIDGRVGGGSLRNIGTGKICGYSIRCGRIGLGLLISWGGRIVGSILVPHCGKDIGGFNVQIAGDIVVPGAGGVGGGLGRGGNMVLILEPASLLVSIFVTLWPQLCQYTMRM